VLTRDLSCLDKNNEIAIEAQPVITPTSINAFGMLWNRPGPRGPERLWTAKGWNALGQIGGFSERAKAP